jgi:hypothetical protein
MLGDAHERRRLGALATERVRGYSLEVIATRYVEMYESLLGDPLG